MRYPKRAYTFSADYFSTPESVDPFLCPISELIPSKLKKMYGVLIAKKLINPKKFYSFMILYSTSVIYQLCIDV